MHSCLPPAVGPIEPPSQGHTRLGSPKTTTKWGLYHKKENITSYQRQCFPVVGKVEISHAASQLEEAQQPCSLLSARHSPPRDLRTWSGHITQECGQQMSGGASALQMVHTCFSLPCPSAVLWPSRNYIVSAN